MRAAWTRAVEQPADWEQFYEDALSLPRAYRRLGDKPFKEKLYAGA